jgi:Transposase DDE domain
LRNLKAKRGRQVAKFEAKEPRPNYPSERMRQAIDSSKGRQLYSQRIATVEPVFANIRRQKKMDRFTLRTKVNVGIQWLLYCVVHNIEKMATKAAYAG